MEEVLMPINIDGTGSVSGLDAVDVPVYANTTARDSAIASPAAGQVVFVTGTGSQVYDGSAWSGLGSLAGAAISNTPTGNYTSGAITYDYWTYNSSGSISVATEGFADLLVIGGGAGGAYNSGGGGGGSGAGFQTYVYLSAGSKTITVGSGGAAGTSNQGFGGFSSF
jgi:hypothetical protein